ncbi:MAG: DUF2842 domain-containing protein [Alphaproteobacteria bacterium]|nr:DUF2842 domain-containing protein [Alphaproteobacteria bacterium]
MPSRIKKLIGTIVMLIWLAVYAMIAMTIGVAILPGAAWPIELAYYAIAGLAWTLPLFPLIWWMNKPGPDEA